MTTPWNMARAASRRELPKPRKMMGPVGEKRFSWGERLEDSWEGRLGDRYPLPESRVEAVNVLGTPQHEVSACRACGFHVCSCEPEPEPAWKPTCMYCGAEQEDLGPLKTRMICVSCAGERKPKHPNGCPCTGCVPPLSEAQAKPPTFMEKYGQFVSAELKRALDQKARGYKFPVLTQIEYGQTAPAPKDGE